MPPKNKKTKAEEALDFLSNLDNLDETPPAAASPKETTKPTSSTPRPSTDSSRPKTDTPGTADPRKSSEQASTQKSDPAEDEEAAKALAFLEAQINTKRQPLSVPQSRSATPKVSAAVKEQEKKVEIEEPAASTSTAQGGGGWGSSWWSSASSALQSAQKIADEQYQKVRTEGVGGVTGQLEHLNVKGVDLAKLRKEAEERLGGIVKNVDLEKLRQDLYNNTSSALNNIINTVAPPISAHETLELWLSHPMTGYAGVEGVVYRAWLAILDQTESGELVIVWSPPESATGTERAINQVEGFEKGWEIASGEIKSTKGREDKDPKGRKQNGVTPVTTVPIFLHLQPVLAPLAIPEPQLLLDSTSGPSKPKHLHFILTLQDPTHNLQFTTISQSIPGDWLEVEYEQSEWVEERLVDIIRVSVEIIAQDYVATRMALKPSAKTQTRPATPGPEAVEAEGKATETVSTEPEAGGKKDD